jgi:hypothetical protein
MTQTSNSLAAKMTEHFGVAPEWCRRCDSPVWANEEDEVFVDSRELTSSCEDGSPASEFCPGTDQLHEV